MTQIKIGPIPVGPNRENFSQAEKNRREALQRQQAAAPSSGRAARAQARLDKMARKAARQ